MWSDCTAFDMISEKKLNNHEHNKKYSSSFYLKLNEKIKKLIK